eukprot:TRINITY_DN2167_c0_g1_i1.p2 TRINITY_DN2167_c0_g1~~TRINITY_DN2167_c0_g1_i1.p2  ORF type:complete len:400 (+),score=157.95 TRINITY_DN2167_c0_g1_i1:156-1202(+)
MTFGVATFPFRRSGGKNRAAGPGPVGYRGAYRQQPPTACASSDYDEFPITHAELGLRERRSRQNEQLPNQEARLKQRIKQVGIGKATQGYLNYLKAIPKEQRIPTVNLNTPSTSPRTIVSMSKRQFHGELKAWRKYLHHFDDISEAADSTSLGAVGSSDSDAGDFPVEPVQADEHAVSYSEAHTEGGDFYGNNDQLVYDEQVPYYNEDPAYQSYPEEYQQYQDYEGEYVQFDGTLMDMQEAPHGTEGHMYNELPEEQYMVDEFSHKPLMEMEMELPEMEPLPQQQQPLQQSQIYQELPAEGFPSDPNSVDYRYSSQPPPLHDLSFTSLVDGTPMTNIEALEAQLIAYN